MSEYPRGELLAETDWLAEHLDDPRIRIVDCDEWPAYQRAHIPGAVGLQGGNYFKDPENPLHIMTAPQFEEQMGRLGISNDTQVVAYDGSGGLYAARLWWSLDRYGHSDVKVLNGGIDKWMAEGRPLTRRITRAQQASFQARDNDACLCTLDYLLENRSRDDVVIWDVRSEAEYTGENPRQNKFGGHIPGAVNLEWLNLVTDDERRIWKPASELRQMLAEIGITPEKEVLVH